jgi:hypothetical protein
VELPQIFQLLVCRVTVTAEGLVLNLRTDGISGVMRDLMTPRNGCDRQHPDLRAAHNAQEERSAKDLAARQ